MRLEEWLLGLSRTAQYVIALLLLGVSTFTYMNGWVWPWGWILGFILLVWSCFAPSQPKENDDSGE